MEAVFVMDYAIYYVCTTLREYEAARFRYDNNILFTDTAIRKLSQLQKLSP